jgi:hypothetical protein
VEWFGGLLFSGLGLLVFGGLASLTKLITPPDKRTLTPAQRAAVKRGDAAARMAVPVVILGSIATFVGGAGLLILHILR